MFKIEDIISFEGKIECYSSSLGQLSAPQPNPSWVDSEAIPEILDPILDYIPIED